MITSLKEYLLSFRHIAIVSHVRPDGDALGSSLALREALVHMGVKATVVNATADIEKKYAFLEGFRQVKQILPSGCECVVLVDCSCVKRTGLEIPHTLPCVVIDHHVSASSLSMWDCINTDASSTAEVVYRLLESWQIPLNRHSAMALYVGIVNDTDFFKHHVNKDLFSIVATLMTKGVNPNEIAYKIAHANSLAKLRLKALALHDVELLCDGRVGCVYLSQQMFDITGATYTDSEDIIDEIMALAVVDVGVMIRSNGAKSFKISLRSKGKDVSKIAVSFGGGGHMLRSGFEIAYQHENEYKRIQDKIIQLIQGV